MPLANASRRPISTLDSYHCEWQTAGGCSGDILWKSALPRRLLLAAEIASVRRGYLTALRPGAEEKKNEARQRRVAKIRQRAPGRQKSGGTKSTVPILFGLTLHESGHWKIGRASCRERV